MERKRGGGASGENTYKEGRGGGETIKGVRAGRDEMEKVNYEKKVWES